MNRESLKESLLLYAVTDRYWLKEGERLADAVKEALEGGATFIQIREKVGEVLVTSPTLFLPLL